MATKSGWVLMELLPHIRRWSSRITTLVDLAPISIPATKTMDLSLSGFHGFRCQVSVDPMSSLDSDLNRELPNSKPRRWPAPMRTDLPPKLRHSGSQG